MSKPEDFASREQALDTRYSYAISAPAGSGKTGLITQRLLALLATVEQPENILAITFTKKAAAEMQHRVLLALRDAAQNDNAPDNEYEQTTWKLARAVLQKDVEHNWQLLSLPNRLRITTIDSFCFQLSQQLPLDNAIGITDNILDSAEMTYAYRMAARATLQLLDDSELSDDLAKLITHFNNQLSTIESLFILLLARREQWLSLLFSTKDQRDALEGTLQAIINSHLSELKQLLQPYGSDLALLLDYAATNLQASESIIAKAMGIQSLPNAHVDSLDQWLALVELLTTAKGDFRKRITKKEGFPTNEAGMSTEEKQYGKQQRDTLLEIIKLIEKIPELAQALNLVRLLPAPRYSHHQWGLLDSLSRVLIMLVAQLKLVFKQLAKVDYAEITMAALNALGDSDKPEQLALKLDYQIQHILIDEFQDTSSPQLDLLKRLTAGWQHNDGRTLFIVGDAMQSCYGFRDANVGIFLNIRQFGFGDISILPLDLTVNFRSTSNIVNWVNAIFCRVFPDKNSINHGAVKYTHAVPFNQEQASSAVNSHLFAVENIGVTRHEEAKKIASLIKEEQAIQPTTSIAILVRSRQQVMAITEALQEQSIAYRAKDIDRLNANMAILDMLSLTRVLLYPNDRIAWLSLLRSPWCGLDMYDIYRVATAGKKEGQWQDILTILSDQLYSAELQELSRKNALDRFTNIITQALSQRGRYSLRAWVEATWLQLGGSATLPRAQQIYDIYSFLNLLETYDHGGHIKHWPTFVDAVSQLYVNAEETLPSDVPVVEIMTLHKSKGLEFDVVFIPGIDKNPPPDQQQLLSWIEWLDRDNYPQLVISPVHPTGAESDPIYRYIREQIKYKQRLEGDRLFYVGCTRAIKQLHLLGYVKHALKNTDEPDIKTPGNHSTLATIWDLIKNQAHVEYCREQEPDQAPIAKPTQQILALSEQWQAPAYPTNQLLEPYLSSQYWQELAGDNIAKPDLLNQRYHRYFGTVLHSAIQQLTEMDDNDQESIDLSVYAPFWQQALRQLGMPEKLSQFYRQKIVKTITMMCSSKHGKWLLSNRHSQSECELSLWSLSGPEPKELIVDRTFIANSDGQLSRWVIDYKSSEPQPGQSLADFIEHETQLYAKQLASYKRLFEDEPYPICTALYFPVIDELQVIEHV